MNTTGVNMYLLQQLKLLLLLLFLEQTCIETTRNDWIVTTHYVVVVVVVVVDQRSLTHGLYLLRIHWPLNNFKLQSTWYVFAN